MLAILSGPIYKDKKINFNFEEFQKQAFKSITDIQYDS